MGEETDSFETEGAMKIDTGIGEIFIFDFGAGNTGINVDNAHNAQPANKLAVKKPAQPATARVLTDINGSFNVPVIGGSFLERPRIGIAENLAVFNRLYVRIFFNSFDYPPPKFFGCRRNILKRNGSALNIRGVNCRKLGGIVGRNILYFDGHINQLFPQRAPSRWRRLFLRLPTCPQTIRRRQKCTSCDCACAP